MSDPFRIRPATLADVPALHALIGRSGIELSAGFYTMAQAQAITAEVFGVDTQLIADGTYFVVEAAGAPVACGGWSRRHTLFGGDQTKSGEDPLLDPAKDAARIRAFFVEPAMARRGFGRLLLTHCTRAAHRAGFRALELAATMPGEPLYAASGFAVTQRFEVTLAEGITVPLATMRRSIDALEGFSVVPTTTAAQIEGYNRCVDRIARERRYFGIMEGPPLESSTDFVEAARVRRGVHLVALDADAAVVGWCDVARHVRPGFDHCGRLGMGLLPEVRGLGLGERLLRATLDSAAQQGFERVELEVFASNANAHALYLRLGFMEEGRKRGARKLDGVYDDDVLMVRWLVPMPPHAYASPAPRSP